MVFVARDEAIAAAAMAAQQRPPPRRKAPAASAADRTVEIAPRANSLPVEAGEKPLPSGSNAAHKTTLGIASNPSRRRLDDAIAFPRRSSLLPLRLPNGEAETRCGRRLVLGTKQQKSFPASRHCEQPGNHDDTIAARENFLLTSTDAFVRAFSPSMVPRGTKEQDRSSKAVPLSLLPPESERQ